MGFEPGFVPWPPLRFVRLRFERECVDGRFAHGFSPVVKREEGQVRDIAVDVHIDFCEVAIAEAGAVGSAGWISCGRLDDSIGRGAHLC